MSTRDPKRCIDLTADGLPSWTLAVLVAGPGDEDFLLIDEAHYNSPGGYSYKRGLDIPHEQIGPLPQQFTAKLRAPR